MADLKTSPHQLTFSSSQIQDIYSGLEQEIFKMFVDRLNSKGLVNDNIEQWQIQKLNELHLVNEQTIELVSKATGLAKPALKKLFMDNGAQVYNSTIKDVQAGIEGQVVINNTIDQVLKGYLDQTFLDLDNNVNQTLLTTNFGDSPVAKTYQQIIKETAANVISGFKTPDRALADTIYKWRNQGITPVMIDKGGHQWSLDSYARTVIDTTSTRAFQAVRDQAASDNGIDTFVMSSHAACRPACAPIQGKLVTTRREGFKAEGEWFEPLDNHGYGEPGGTFGINCSHIKWPYIPGVNTNNQEQFDPQESVEKYKWQQKQRALERKVRESKRNEELADQLGDEDGKTKYGLQKLKYQSALRKIVDDHDFLVRDYNRENSFGLSATKQLIKKPAPVTKQSVISRDYKYIGVGDEEHSFLAEQRDKRWESLTGEHKKLIADYTQGMAGEWNSAVQNKYFDHDWYVKGKVDESLKERTGYTVEEYRSTAKKIANTPLGQNMRLFRGVNEDEFNWTKSSNQYRAMTSTATNDSQNDFFSKKRTNDIDDDLYTALGYRVNMYATPGVKGLFIGNKTSYSEDQYEFIMAPDTKYRLLPSDDDHVINIQLFPEDTTDDEINNAPLPNLGKNIMEKTRTQIAAEKKQKEEEEAKQKEANALVSAQKYIGMSLHTNKNGDGKVVSAELHDGWPHSVVWLYILFENGVKQHFTADQIKERLK